MRISTIAGFDAGVSTVSNTNNFVLDSSSNTPNSLVEFEDIKENISGDSVTPVVMSEIAHVDLGLDQTPSMIETQSRLTGSGGSKQKVDLNLIDFEGSNTVSALFRHPSFENSLKNLLYEYPDFDSLNRMIMSLESLKRCHDSYTSGQKYSHTIGGHTKGNAYCLIHENDFQLTFWDAEHIIKKLTSMKMFYPTPCSTCSYINMDPNSPSNDISVTFDLVCQDIIKSTMRLPLDIHKKAREARNAITEHGKWSKDYDIVFGLYIDAISESIVNKTVCDLYTKCPKDMNSFYKKNLTKPSVVDPRMALFSLFNC